MLCVELQLELKLQRDRLQQYKKKINTIMEREHDIARQLLRGDMEGLLDFTCIYSWERFERTMLRCMRGSTCGMRG